MTITLADEDYEKVLLVLCYASAAAWSRCERSNFRMASEAIASVERASPFFIHPQFPDPEKGQQPA